MYRICPENLLENYSGRGASFRDGGRWNKDGDADVLITIANETDIAETNSRALATTVENDDDTVYIGRRRPRQQIA